MCVGVLPVCLCSSGMPDAHRGRERSLDPLELEFRGCEAPWGCWEPNPCPLEEQLILMDRPFLRMAEVVFVYFILCGGREVASV